MSWHFTLQTRAVPRLFFGHRRNRRFPHPRHPHPHRRRHPPDSASPSLHPPQTPLHQSLPRRRRPPPLPHHSPCLTAASIVALFVPLSVVGTRLAPPAPRMQLSARLVSTLC